MPTPLVQTPVQLRFIPIGGFTVMRIPRDVSNAHIQQNYPVLTVTNHDKFADHIKELVDSVKVNQTPLLRAA